MNATEFDHEYAHHITFLDRFALRLTHDRDSAKDLVQETLYRAFSNCDRFEPGTNFKAWMSTIMRNTFVSAYRRRQRSMQNGIALVQRSNQPSAANEALTNLNLGELEAKLEMLDPLYAKPFTLFYSGYRYEEIAEALQLPIGTIKSRIFTARRQLKSLILSARS